MAERIMTQIQKDLFDMQDLGYKEFHQKLMPTINPETVIGVRTPVLRAYAKDLSGDNAKMFMANLAHKYYEENNLHAFLISAIGDFDKCMEELERFLPYIDNWATCDGLRPKCFNKNRSKLLLYIDRWLKSDKEYVVRFAIEMLMVHFLDGDFDEKYLSMVSAVKREEYYIKMMIAWYFATALAKQYESAVVYLQDRKLSDWVHNKTIQKAVESYRITDNQKKYLKSLKINETGQ